MPKVRSQITNYTKSYPLKRDVGADDSLQNQVDTNPQVEQDTYPLRENFASTSSPSVNSTYSTVTLGVLIYGSSTANVPLIYVACLMATASTSPSAMKTLLPLLRDNFWQKFSKK